VQPEAPWRHAAQPSRSTGDLQKVA